MYSLVSQTIIVSCLVASTSMLAVADDDLFSSIATESVFSKSSGSSTKRETSAASTRVAGASSLKRLLKQVELDAKQLTSQVVSLKVSRDDWSIPVLISVSVDKSELEFALLLSKVEDESNVSATKLLELMNVSRDGSPAFFAYSSIRKRIELRQVTSSVGVTAAKLERILDKLATIASETEASWTFDSDSAEDEPARESSTATAESNALTSEALVGVWSASRSDRDAFALQIKSGNQFALAVVSGKTSSKSSGKYTLDGNTISLTADGGAELKGTIELKSKDKFDLKINGSSDTKPLEFTRAST